MNYQNSMNGRNSIPSNYSAVQHHNGGSVSSSSQGYGQQMSPQQQSMNFQSTGSYEGFGLGHMMSNSQQYPPQLMQVPTPLSNQAVQRYSQNNNINNSMNMNVQSGHGGYTNDNQNGVAHMGSNDGDFFSSIENNNPTQNITEISHTQRSLSPASVGSFSMDGDVDDMNFNDNMNETSTQVAPPLHQSSSDAPSAVNNSTAEDQKTTTSHSLLLQKSDGIIERKVSGVKSGDGISNDSNQKHETSLPTEADARTQSTSVPKQEPAPNDQVIELLDDDAEANVARSSTTPQIAGVKRERPTGKITPGSTLPGYQNHNAHNRQSSTVHNNRANYLSNLMMMQQQKSQQSSPQFFTLNQNHTPTWGFPLPQQVQQPQQPRHPRRHFELSLLNLSEFTITGLPVTFEGRPSSCLGFRKIIKRVSQGHGTAVFERDNPKNKNGTTNISSGYEQYSSHGDMANPDGGKWRIPLGAYQDFFQYLVHQPGCRVDGIPRGQLNIASLGKARLEKGFPSAQKLMSYGVPRGLAATLAPFQRGGVDFVVERHGRALIADDMGLGKTIQSIASMSIYHDEWPLLILTPSSARYHWAAEFNNWLGLESSVNRKSESSESPNGSVNPWEKQDSYQEQVETAVQPQNSMRLLRESEIHVMVAGKEKMLPSRETRIVICSYGLATSLVASGKLRPGLFRCAIVDESHMLKNMKTKRTSKLVPILHATKRCILLSGTPALARPSELWPQLKILSTERDGWWDNEDEFVQKYVQRTSAVRRAELHTMLTGTVMIRRLKHNILKSLPKKQREKAVVDILTPDMREEFHTYMKLLREGKGVMAKIAKKHSAVTEKSQDGNDNQIEEKNKRLQSLQAQYNEMCNQKLQSIRYAMQSVSMNEADKENMIAEYFNQAKAEVDVWYKERIHELEQRPAKQEEELDRKTILNKMYTATAKAKIPFIAELVGKWLGDPTKGKLCIFAHHIYVLDEIVKLVGLSNRNGSTKRFIRIDGSTNPKERQAQIVAFQNDPDIRIAVLGITAAGVAVTLTASSTVWFTELFWTPALMIQAEDRCHRIGQNAAVKCLYFVASGTLDVLLWDLLEKKFRDLGEFVEGKEKMKIVVQRTYKSVAEVQSIFDKIEDDDADEDAKLNENDMEAEGDDLIKLENDLQDDIVQLAEEEMGMIKQEQDDEDGADNNRRIALQVDNGQPAQPKSTLGQTEDEAICLSDDDEDEAVVLKPDAKEKPTSPPEVSSNNRVLIRPRFYKQWFKGASYGIQLLKIGRRLTVIQNTFGKQKPAFGDVLVAVNGHRVVIDADMNIVITYMKKALEQNTTELIFLEDEEFLKKYSSQITQSAKEIEAMTNKRLKSAPPANSKDSAIEILDDD